MSFPVPRAPDLLRPTTSRPAVAGLVFGLLAFLLGVLASVPAFVFGARALGEIKRDPVHVKGRGLALAGIFAAGLGLFLQPLLLLYGVRVVRDRVLRATDAANLRHIGEAMRAYADAHTTRLLSELPPAATTDADGRPLLSWRVALLPYLGERELYDQFHADEPWDSPHNFALVGRMPKVYAHPADPDAAAKGLTYYRVFVGGGPFGNSFPPFVGEKFHKGPENTFLVVEAAEPVPWTKPEELSHSWLDPVPKLGGLLRGGSNALYFDWTVRFLPDDVPQLELRERIGFAFDGIPPDW